MLIFSRAYHYFKVKSEGGLENSKRFQSLMSGIERLVSACSERRVKKHI